MPTLRFFLEQRWPCTAPGGDPPEAGVPDRETAVQLHERALSKLSLGGKLGYAEYSLHLFYA